MTPRFVTGPERPDLAALLDTMWASHTERLWAPLLAPSPFPPRALCVLDDLFPEPRLPEVPEALRVDLPERWP
jgi:crotonobetainyl-CoA:carnitine CoA-transferase CaiB-like acyl-CoA transferase